MTKTDNWSHSRRSSWQFHRRHKRWWGPNFDMLAWHHWPLQEYFLNISIKMKHEHPLNMNTTLSTWTPSQHEHHPLYMNTLSTWTPPSQHEHPLNMNTTLSTWTPSQHEHHPLNMNTLSTWTPPSQHEHHPLNMNTTLSTWIPSQHQHALNMNDLAA